MSFTGHKLGNIDGLADAAKTVLEGKINVYELAASLTDEDASDFITAAAHAKQEGKSHFMFNGKSYPVTIGDDVAKQIEAKLDPVGKEDDDVDNDGDVDDSDEYLKKRRDAIDKAIDDEEEQEESADLDEAEAGVYKSNDEVAPDTDKGKGMPDDVEVKDGEEEEAEEPKEVKPKAESADSLVANLEGISEKATEEEEDVQEGKMNQLHQLVSSGVRDPKKIAKELGLKPSKDTTDAIAALIKGMK